ncbi:hypothetical protein BMF94_0232 [Rhodotorula taiwanensis]|uniref:Defective in cullin neddylation protein n=1 Tax=Rhodotorula taiwanensis TaxID=741276 RepID=A0A2S5BIQ3_9BASI|nr:hypothetical protein BMF94_0232 [Rhodotorula taiwanensis]
MPPKRKTDSPAKAAPKKKRSSAVDDAPAASSSKATASTTKAKASSSTASTSKLTKGKSKKKEPVVISSSESESADSDVIVESPKKAKKASSNSKGKGKEEKPKSTKPAKVASKASKSSKAYAYDPVESTSTPGPESAPKPPAKSSKAKPVAKPASFEEAFPRFFATYAEPEDEGTMGGAGIEKLFEAMELSMDGAYPMILAYKVEAKPGTFGTFSRADFRRAFEPTKIASAPQLKDSLLAVHRQLFDSEASEEDFRRFYLFLFPFLKSDGAKTIPAEMAIPLLGISLGERYELGKAFVDFATAQGTAFKAVSLDVWTQLLEFCQSVEPDLTGWSEDDAWPSTIDAFVDWKKGQESTA